MVICGLVPGPLCPEARRGGAGGAGGARLEGTVAGGGRFMVVSEEKRSSGGAGDPLFHGGSGGTHTGVSEGPAQRDGCEGTPKWEGRAWSHERTPKQAHSPEWSPEVPEPRSCEGGGCDAGAAGGDGGRAGRVPAPRRSPRTLPPSAAAAAIGSRAAPSPGSRRSRSAAIAMSFLL